MQKNIIISIIASVAIIGGATYFVTNTSPAPGTENAASQSRNVEIRDGVQYVTVTAQGGYSPRTTVVKPGLPTKLIVKTNGTYDCSASLVMKKVGFQKILQPTGEEVIDLGTIAEGDEVQGVCGMGMYNFQITAG